MDLQERIRAIVEQAIPIYYLPTPEHEKDCRVKILYKEGMRALRIQTAWIEVKDLITSHQGKEPGAIISAVNDYFTHYFENHPHK